VNQELDRRTIVALVACFILALGYDQYLKRRYPDYYNPKDQPAATDTTKPLDNVTTPVAQSPSTAAATSVASPEMAAKTPSSNIQKLSENDAIVETSDAIFRFDPESAGIASVLLKGYKAHAGKDTSLTNVLDSALRVSAGIAAETTVSGMAWSGSRQGRDISFSRTADQWEIAQTYAVPESGYAPKLTVSIKNLAATPRDLTALFAFSEAIHLDTHKKSWFAPGNPAERARIVAYIAGSEEFHEVDKYCESADKPLFSHQNKGVNFIGFDRHYFLAAFMPDFDRVTSSVAKSNVPSAAGTCDLTGRLEIPAGIINAGQAFTFAMATYFGPKAVEALAGQKGKLDLTLGLGWLDAVAKPLLSAIKFFYGLAGNYGIAIILVTVILKILFYPLTRQAAVSTHRMKKFNPEMNRIRERYKDDRQAQQRELMKFMSTHKINPMKGCLPILPQIPVFFAFYRVLSASIELRHAPLGGWINDLSVADPYFVTPLLLGACMFVQQKLTPMTGMDKAQERMMMMMPVIFTVFMLTLPSGMVIYMLANTIVSIAQQQWLNRKLAQTV